MFVIKTSAMSLCNRFEQGLHLSFDNVGYTYQKFSLFAKFFLFLICRMFPIELTSYFHPKIGWVFQISVSIAFNSKGIKDWMREEPLPSSLDYGATRPHIDYINLII